MSFLLQIYTGGNWDHASAFHRTAYVFVCTTAACYQRGNCAANHVRVFRSQLPRANAAFPDVPPSEADPTATIARCSEAVRDRHSGAAAAAHPAARTFPEFTLVIDEDPGPDTPDDDAAAAPTVELDTDAMTAEEEADMREALDHGQERRKFDDQFARFKSQVDPEPSQVLRYSKGGAPLWIGPGHEASTEPPKCEHCGGARTFEFQVMPQLLHELEVDAPQVTESLDWGVLAVFTCAASCDTGSEYAEEWVFSNIVSADPMDDDDDDDTDDDDDDDDAGGGVGDGSTDGVNDAVVEGVGDAGPPPGAS